MILGISKEMEGLATTANMRVAVWHAALERTYRQKNGIWNKICRISVVSDTVCLYELLFFIEGRH